MTLSVVHHEAIVADLPPGHRFPMHKYLRLAEVLVEEAIVPREAFVRPGETPADWLALVHDRAYVDAVLGLAVPRERQREIGFPVEETVMRRARVSVGSTIVASRVALEEGIACTTAGGSHHARKAGGAGFCVFNDVAVAARLLVSDGTVDKVLVIDCDVHQGDGTAEIFAGDDDVFTFSIHAERNYPVRKVPSDLDIPLPDGTRDEAYLEALREVLPPLIERVAPDIVFYNAGVDPHAEDRLGRLSLTDAGIAERDRTVIGTLRDRGIPVAGVIGGGYSTDLDALARRHASLHRAAAEFASGPTGRSVAGVLNIA